MRKATISAAVDQETFRALPPRDQAAVMRALVHLGRAADAAALPLPDGAGPMVLDLRADALLEAGRPEEALATVERRERTGKSSVSLGLRARALAALGRVAEAERDIDAAGADPNAYLARVIRGEARLAAGDAAGARPLLEAAVAEHPRRRRGLLALVAACAAMGDWVTGSAYAARLLETQGEDAGEGELSAPYLRKLQAFYEATGETNRVADMEAMLEARRVELEARLVALRDGSFPASRAIAAETRSRGDGESAQPSARAKSTWEAPSLQASIASPQTMAEGERASVTDAERAAVEALMRRHMGFSGLRPGQAEVITRVLRGEDVLAIMPTGGGKSICYQLPGVIGKGVTLVVSPLIALMKDQLDGLPPAMRAAAASITSELSPPEARAVVEEVAQGRYRLLYVAPERLRQTGLLRALRKAGVARLVVDEAHCVSVWGHDFRPDYLGITEARRNLGDPPVLALTATAPPRVAKDILDRLGPLHRVTASIARPNLRFEAVHCRDAEEKLRHLHALCKETRGPGIAGGAGAPTAVAAVRRGPGLVYVNSRAKAEQISEALRQTGINAFAYHAGRPDRAHVQDAFMRNTVDVLVATVAFGMGVDKPDIRFVFHHDPASSIENYYQEAGRAGRDGEPARCVLLTTSADQGALKQRAKGDLPSRDLVQNAWALVLNSMLDGEQLAIVDLKQLGALDAEDDVKPRVALSILAEAGALERIADVPQRITVRSRDARFAGIDGRETPIAEIARRLSVALQDVEATLYDLQESGAVSLFQPQARGILHRVTGDLSRVEAVLDRYSALAEQRAKEIMDYARAVRCRHQYLRAYFGEDAPARCATCDVCLGIEHRAPEEGIDDEEAGRVVLEALASMRGIGEQNLVWMLRGDARSPEWTTTKPGYAALGLRSESRLKNLVRGLIERGHLEREVLEHGGTTIKLAAGGKRALASGERVTPEPKPKAEASASAPSARKASGEAKPDEPPVALDEAAQRRFDALKAWRRQQADADNVPPYVVAHDSMLRAIAAANPADAATLLTIKGMGPKRVEKHGETILRVLREA